MTRLAVLLCSFCFFGFADTQILNELKGRFKQSATNNATDFNTSRSNKEKNLNRSSEGTEKTTADEDLMETPTPTEKPTIKDEFSFSIKAVYSSQNTGDEEANLTKFYVGEKASLIQDEASVLILDFESQQVLMTDSISRQVIVSSNPNPAEMPMEMASMLQKTGATKTVMGMTAYEFTFITPQTKIWITENSPLNEGELASFREFERSIFGFNYSQLSGLNGITVGFSSYGEDMQLLTEFNLSEFIKTRLFIDLRGYEVN